MIATRESTVRDAVIILLRRKGHGPIQATDLWDRIYSKQYESAKPGITHKFIIGGYEFEYIKQQENFPELVDVIAQASQEAHNLETGSKVRAWVQLIAVLVILGIVIALTSHLFEDGSFIVLGFIKGCLPWGICS